MRLILLLRLVFPLYYLFNQNDISYLLHLVLVEELKNCNYKKFCQYVGKVLRNLLRDTWR